MTQEGGGVKNQLKKFHVLFEWPLLHGKKIMVNFCLNKLALQLTQNSQLHCRVDFFESIVVEAEVWVVTNVIEETDHD